MTRHYTQFPHEILPRLVQWSVAWPPYPLTRGFGQIGAHPRARPSQALRSLLDLQFASLAMGHGLAIIDTAKSALRTYLEAEANLA